MKKIILLLAIAFNAYGKGGPNGPPNPACYGPNPPPWCNNPPVPIDNWQPIVTILLIGMIIGFSKTKQLKANGVEQ